MPNKIEFTILFFIFSVFGSTVEGESCNVQGYYWRDYTGKIPDDALPGGIDVNGRPIYIGQIFNSTFLIPAKITSTDGRAFYEYGGLEHTATDNIKILCTQHPENLECVETNNLEIVLLINKHLVFGGNEPGCSTYIGRIRQGGEIVVGKVLADTPICAGLHVTKDGRGIRQTGFEILTYNLHGR